MSTRRVQSSAIKPRTLGAAAAVTPWIRNPSWLALTAVGDSEQRFRGLVAVFPQGTYLALLATTSTGTYTVDWGDGSTPVNVNSNTQANYFIDFNDADLAGTNAPVTLTDTGDLVERTAHGYVNGMEVRFYNIVSTTGLTTAQTYYVINATTNNFQVTTKVGDVTQIVALTTNGTATLLPYKQAIVNVTPTTANLSTFNLNRKNTTSGLQAYETGWLDIELSLPNHSASALTLSGTSVRFAMCERAALRNVGSCNSFASLFSTFRVLKEVVITSSNSAVTNMSNMFLTCESLQTLAPFNTAAVTTMEAMFSGCRALIAVPLFNTVAVQNMLNMLAGCSSLETVPLFNTGAVTNMSGMFENCAGLTTIPRLNTVAVTNMISMFKTCSSLQTVPLFNTGAVTKMTNMFQNCLALTSVPLFNTAAVDDMENMFAGCTSLASVPLFNTEKVVNMKSMLTTCSTLQAVPLFNTEKVTNISGMLGSCTSLTTVPLFNTAAVTIIDGIVFSCNSLASFPALNVSAVTSATNFANMFTNCNSLSRMEAKNFRFSFSVASCRLGATELNEIYTNLPKLNPDVTNASGSGSVVTYTVNDITAFAVGRTVTITGVNPAAYNLTSVTIATVTVGTSQFTVNNVATGTYVSGGVAAIQSDRTITVSNNWGTASDDPTIATAKGWIVTG